VFAGDALALGLVTPIGDAHSAWALAAAGAAAGAGCGCGFPTGYFKKRCDQ